MLLRTLLGACLLTACTAIAAADGPRVRLVTSLGDVVLELDAAQAPGTVENFLGYVDAGFYDGTIFHRVIPGFMAQGGGFTAALEQLQTRAPIQNEADNGLRNLRGSIAMARTSDPHSASAQFFINLVDNEFLDHQGKTMRGWGYAVFGRVIEGMEVVERMAAAPTTARGPFQDLPAEPITIERATREPAP